MHILFVENSSDKLAFEPKVQQRSIVLMVLCTGAVITCHKNAGNSTWETVRRMDTCQDITMRTSYATYKKKCKGKVY